ncbi:MAG: CinA family protein [Syntrophobacterales bacterium]|nr:MAG: CinA family protein [Syntrophobacterales bacterium]
MEEDRRLEERIGHLLRRRKATLSVAESCTGGLIVHRITNVSGSSDYFEMGIISYSNRSKQKFLNVPQRDIGRYGSVSHQVTEKMAQGIRLKAKTDIGLATTGIAGPLGGTRETPVGTVFIGLDHEGGTEIEKFHFGGDREEIKEKASQKSLERLMDYLIEMGNKASKKTT